MRIPCGGCQHLLLGLSACAHAVDTLRLGVRVTRMRAYLLSLLGVALAVTLVDLLVPERGKSAVRLLSALILLCVIAAPLPKAFRAVRDYTLPDSTGELQAKYEKKLQEAMDFASKTYLVQTITSLICTQFDLNDQQVRCKVVWQAGEAAVPERITVILSGSAIWKDPEEIENFVSKLVGCPCDTAIE